ncbi:Thermonuclease [bacterium HR29]|nr:Thermonuclease [bacterium HR29]
MRHRVTALFAVAATLVAILAAACTPPTSGDGEPTAASKAATTARSATPTPPPTSSPALTPTATPYARPVRGALPSECEPAQLLRVIDGDTIAVVVGGQSETVRLIGVDAPELHHPTRGAEPYGAEAAAYLARLLAGQRFCLERDISERDRYGRLLRYVWLEDGTLVNEALVAAGMAMVVTYPPDVKYAASRFLPAQTAAREAGRGLWGEAAALPTIPPPNPGGSGGFAPPACYVPGRNTCNCSDFSSRAQAQWFHETLDPRDINRLDADGDGLACESLP